MKKILSLLLLAATSVSLHAANWYVEKSATGTGAGTSWTNAWTEMSSINFGSVACGDTIWLGGGTYSSTMTAVKNCSAGSTLNIKRVLSTDTVPVAAPGWNSAFDSQVILLNWSGFAGFRLNGINNVVIDGRVGYPLGATPIPYGISLQCSTPTQCDGINDGADNSNYAIENIEVYGPSCVTSSSCVGNGASGVNLPNGGTGFTYHNVYVHRWGEDFRAANWFTVTIENSFIADTNNDGIQHEDIVYDNGSFGGGSTAINGFTFRYNTVFASPNDGMFMDGGGQTNFFIYGNQFYHNGGQILTFKFVSGFTKATNINIFNNTVSFDGYFAFGGSSINPGWFDFSNVAQSTVSCENNIFDSFFWATNTGGGPNIPPACDYNAYSISGNKDAGAHTITYTSTGQFISPTISSGSGLTGNYQLTSTGQTTFQNGLTLSSPYTTDLLGVTRGAGGHWTMGAFQTAGTPPPTTTPRSVSGKVSVSGKTQ